MQKPNACVGIDIAEKRGRAYYVIDRRGSYLDSGWLTGAPAEILNGVTQLAEGLSRAHDGGVAIGVDSHC